MRPILKEENAGAVCKLCNTELYDTEGFMVDNDPESFKTTRGLEWLCHRCNKAHSIDEDGAIQ